MNIPEIHKYYSNIGIIIPKPTINNYIDTKKNKYINCHSNSLKKYNYLMPNIKYTSFNKNKRPIQYETFIFISFIYLLSYIHIINR